MIAQTLQYIDYDGNDVNETFYFHINKAELLKFTAKYNFNLDEEVARLKENSDLVGILKIFEDLIKLSIGKRVTTDDGTTKFVKPKGYSDEFLASDAYGELLEGLLGGSIDMNMFVSGVTATNKKPKTVEVVEDDEVKRLKARLAEITN